MIDLDLDLAEEEGVRENVKEKEKGKIEMLVKLLWAFIVSWIWASLFQF
jgi:hypothetical protein